MIKKIRDILKPKPITNPYGLKDGQIAKLKGLSTNTAFKDFQELLDSLCTLLAEGLLLESDEANLHMTRGYILGLRRAGTIVDEIINSLESADVGQRRDAAREQRERERRRLATFGTGFWRDERARKDRV